MHKFHVKTTDHKYCLKANESGQVSRTSVTETMASPVDNTPFGELQAHEWHVLCEHCRPRVTIHNLGLTTFPSLTTTLQTFYRIKYIETRTNVA